MTLNTHKTGLALGFFFGGLHFVWSLLVALGIAQTLVNWSLAWHMINYSVSVAPFSLTNAVSLVVAAAVVGYILGWVFATIWNKVHEK